MSLDDSGLIRLITELGSIREMRTTVSSTLQCGMISFICVVLGGMITGPRGISIGGAIGAAVASYFAVGQFKSVPHILLNETTVQQKQRLANALREVLQDQNKVSIASIASIAGRAGVQNLIRQVVRNFLTNEMACNVV